MDLGLAGKTAIVTGGSAGIGLACATALYSEGVSVLIAARQAERLARAAETIRAAAHIGEPEVVTIEADISRAADAERVARAALDRWSHIDILINNAGAARAGAFLELPDDAFLEAWTLKTLGYMRMVRAVAPSMIERRDGRIVNIVGGAGRTPGPLSLAVGSANAALLNFTRGISKELARHHVRINAISPGSTATDRARRLAEQTAAASGKSVEQVEQERDAAIPLGRITAPEEIAAMALLLVSDRVRTMTGAEVLLDGGVTPGV